MSSLWDRLMALEGLTLQTASGHDFLVQRVGRSGVGGVIVIPGRSGTPRRISRREFVKADELGLVARDVTPTQLRAAKVSERNPAYVAPLLRAIA